MSLIPHHTSDAVCALCEQKLEQAYFYLVRWYRKKKLQYNNVHISWSYRDRDNQEQAFTDGKSHLHYPMSPHNRCNPSTMEPESRALDLFQLSDEGKAVFSPTFYARLADDCQRDGDEIIWGGNFKSIGDFDHFQYNPEKHT